MDSPEAPRREKDLASLIDAWSRENPEGRTAPRSGSPSTAGRLRRLIGAVAIASALDGLRDERRRDRFVIKGGTAMEMRFGLAARSSLDLDASFRGDIGVCLALTSDALERGWSGFTAIVSEPMEITRATVSPKPVRVDVKVSYRGKAFITIPLEISTAEGESATNPERVALAFDLSRVNLSVPPSVAFLPLRYQIAQKLHACSERFEGRENARVRDLADLMLLRTLCEGSAEPTRLACIEIFQLRGLHPWPPAITPEPGWVVEWENMTRDEDLTISLEQALEEVGDLVRLIDAGGTFDLRRLGNHS